MPDEVVDTPFGKFLIPKGDLIGETLRAGTLWDGPGFLQVIAKEYAEFNYKYTVLDIGANLGAFSVWLATMDMWKVIAIEPVPETMRYLKANLDLNKSICADTVIPLEVAAYDRDTQLICPVPLDAGNLGGTALRPSERHAHGSIRAEPLDHYQWLFGRKVSLIKIDAQGCDGAAIMGLQQTILKHHPAIVFEWEIDLVGRHGYQLDDIRGFLAGIGYETHEWPSQPGNFLAVWHA
jgi:FkbM family methyltransferase